MAVGSARRELTIGARRCRFARPGAGGGCAVGVAAGMGETETGVVRRGVGPRLKRRRPGQVRDGSRFSSARGTLGRLLERQQFWLVYQPPRRSVARFSKRATDHRGWLSSVEAAGCRMSMSEYEIDGRRA
jgi:hypothetical protein